MPPVPPLFPQLDLISNYQVLWYWYHPHAIMFRLLTIFFIFIDAYFSLDDSDCYGNYTVINADILTSPDTGLMYIISNSISTNGRWWYPDETEVQCSTSDASDPFLCQVGPGYITLYTGMGMLSEAFDGIYRACIDGLCLHVRIFGGVVYDSMYEEGEVIKMFTHLYVHEKLCHATLTTG